jgi:hypothetical protein
MGGTDNPGGRDVSGGAGAQERRRANGKPIVRRAAVKHSIARQRLEDFQNTLSGLAVAVFGDQATVVAHLRASSGREWLTFVV